MSTSNDISNLFKLFGGRSSQYKEITAGNKKHSFLGGASDASEGEPRGAAVASVHSPQAAKVAQESVAVADAPIVQDPLPSSASDTTQVWAAESLQSLLSKLAQDDCYESIDDIPAPEQVSSLANVKIVAVISAKGGVGKSTLAAGLATAMQRQGQTVLAVDLDPQSALSNHLGVAISPLQVDSPGLAHCAGDADMRAFCQPTPSGVFLLPYGGVDEIQRRALECQLADEPNWLARHLSELQLEDGSLVVLDTPPGPSVYLQQALSVANVALVVTLADAASYSTLPMVDRLLATYTAGRNDFYESTYVINQVDRSLKLSKDITQIMRGILGDRLAGIVHRDQSVAEALAYNQSVLDYDTSGQGCHDILAIAVTVSEKLESTSRSRRQA